MGSKRKKKRKLFTFKEKLKVKGIFRYILIYLENTKRQDEGNN